MGGGGGGGAGGAVPAPSQNDNLALEPLGTAHSYSAVPEDTARRRYALAGEAAARAGAPLTQEAKPRFGGRAGDWAPGDLKDKPPTAGTGIYRGVSVATNGRIEMQPVLPDSVPLQAGNSLLANNDRRRLSDSDALDSAETPGLVLGDEPTLGKQFQLESKATPTTPEVPAIAPEGRFAYPPPAQTIVAVDPTTGLPISGASNATSDGYNQWQFPAGGSPNVGWLGRTTPMVTNFAGASLPGLNPPEMAAAKDRELIEQSKSAGDATNALTATVRGFYDDSKQTSNGAENARLYTDAKTRLEELQHFDQLVRMKAAGEKTDLQLPKNSMVEIVDTATAKPVESPSLGQKLSGLFSSTVERNARVKVERDQSDVSGVSAGASEKQAPAFYDPYFVQTEVEAIRSDAVLGSVVDNLKLQEAWAKKRGTSTPLPKSEAVKMLKEQLDVKSVGKTDLLDIGVKSDKPEEAANLANAVAQSYRAYRLEQRKKLSEEGIASLQARLTENEQKIRDAQTNVDYLRSKYKISDYMAGDTAPTLLMTGETLRRIEQLRIESQAELARQQSLLEKLNGMRNEPDRLAEAIPTNGIQDTLLGTLREQRSIAEQQLASLQAQNGPENAETKKAAAQVEDLKSKINDRVADVLSGLETRVASLGQSLTNLQVEVDKAMKTDLQKASEAQPYWEAKEKLEALQRARAAMVPNTDEPRPPKPATPPPEPQPEIQTHDNAFSTFSLNVSEVSFKLAVASLEKGVLPEPASIRSEEFINAFDYRDPEPALAAPIAFAWERARYPFTQNRDLLRFSLKTAALGRQAGRPLNLVLLLDNSGSMERADRVGIIHEALRVLATQLQPNDTLSVVLFARTPRLWVDGAPGNQAGKVADELGGLTPEGGTNLGDALDLAYQTALRHYLPAGINRVVLLTDGAANLGNVEPEELKKKVEANRRQGVALDCFGIGWEGYNDDLLEVLTRNGDGRYGFINTPEEAATEFAGQLAGALHVAASDVKVQVEFNPKRVTAYRQIGYAKHQLTKEQFRDNSVDAAELGAAESGNALYVVDVNGGGDGPLATVRVRYKVPGTMQYQEHEWTVPYTGNAVPLGQASPALRLAASASAFSEWLATSPYAAEVTPDSVLGYLRGVPEVYGADARPKKLEWMIRQAKSLAGKQ